MSGFFTPFKNFLMDFMEDTNQDQVVRWGTASQRFEETVNLLRQITNKKNYSSPSSASNIKNGIHQLIEHLNELNPILQSKRIIYNKDPVVFQHIRATLLEIWNNLNVITKSHNKFKLMKWEKEQKKKAMSKKARKNENQEQLIPDEPTEPLSPSEVLGSLPNMNDLSVMYNTITFIMVRDEFNLENFAIDKEPKIDPEFRLARRYRNLLFRTQTIAQKTLNAHVKSGQTGSRITFLFLAKVFAVACFRLPKVLPLIVSAVGLSEELHSEIACHLTDKTFDHTNNDTFYSKPFTGRKDGGISTYYITSDSEQESTLNDSDEGIHPPTRHDDFPFGSQSETTALQLPLTPTPDDTLRKELQAQEAPQIRLLKMANEFPNLFQWPQFHSKVVEDKNDGDDDLVSAGDWLKEFTKKDSMMFFMFLDEWVKHIQKVVGPKFKVIDWPTIKGYRAFIPSFIYTMSRSTTFTKDIQDCSCSMLLTEPTLINYYLRHLYSQTNVYDIFGTVNAISHTEMWFRHMITNDCKLPKEFDHKYFVKAVDIMFQTDHHQLMTRALSMLYSILEVFIGDARVSIVIDLLLHKYFFRLFLHWDSSVRNCYHQLLLFKGLRVKRSHLVSIRLSKDRTINGPSVHDMEHITDTVIYSKIESFLRMLEDQVLSDTKRTRKDFPQELEVYTRRSIEEFTSYKNFYFYWERTNTQKPAKIIPYSLLNEEFKPKTKK